MRAVRFAACFALLACAPFAPGATRAAEPSGAFVLTAGGDTLAIERFERSGGGLRGTLLFRLTGTRTTWRTSELPGGRVARFEAEFAAAADPPGAPPKQAVVVEFRGDSAIAQVTPGGTQRFGTEAGARPFVNPSVALVADLAVHTMPPPGGTATGALFLLAGGRTVEARITRPAADSVVVAFGGVSFCFGLDADGDVVRGRVPEQNLAIARVDSLPDDLLSLPHADYSAPAGAPYTAEEVTVPTRGGFTLAGTLTRPAGVRRAPCVVTITGSGQQDRDESIAFVHGYRPFREIADALGRHGIAVLRLDDRGVGGSGGPVRGATTEDFAQDIEDALAWLRKRPDIDGRRLALLGHSEGGIIAPMVAAHDSRLRGIVLLAAPAWTGRRILEYQNAWAIDHHVAAAGRDSARRAAAAGVDSLAKRDAWLAYFLDHDPLATIRGVKVPVLVLQGETDRQVPAEQAPELVEALRAAGNRDVTLREFPAVDHLFLEDPDGDPAGYAHLRTSTLAQPVLDAIVEWLGKRLR